MNAEAKAVRSEQSMEASKRFLQNMLIKQYFVTNEKLRRRNGIACMGVSGSTVSWN